jgi:hypothetical protein
LFVHAVSDDHAARFDEADLARGWIQLRCKRTYDSSQEPAGERAEGSFLLQDLLAKARMPALYHLPHRFFFLVNTGVFVSGDNLCPFWSAACLFLINVSRS